MATYVVQILQSASRSVEALPRIQRERIFGRIADLANDPRPPGVKLLQGGSERLWRIRVGDFRVIYRIDDGVLLVLVVVVAHRREVYRR